MDLNLPKFNNLLILSSSLVIILLLLVVFFIQFGVNQSKKTYQGSPPSSKSKIETINGFSGVIKSVGKNEIVVVNGEDNREYKVEISTGPKITKGNQEITISKLQAGQRISIYSEKQQKLTQGTAFKASYIDVQVRLDPNTLKPIE